MIRRSRHGGKRQKSTRFSFPILFLSTISCTYPMARRPVFVPDPDARDFVKVVWAELVWHPGFAVSQKKRNIEALHAAAAALGFSPLLEISTKAEQKLGQH